MRGAVRRGGWTHARGARRDVKMCAYFSRRDETPRRRRENRFESDQSRDACAWIQFDHML